MGPFQGFWHKIETFRGAQDIFCPLNGTSDSEGHFGAKNVLFQIDFDIHLIDGILQLRFCGVLAQGSHHIGQLLHISNLFNSQSSPKILTSWQLLKVAQEASFKKVFWCLLTVNLMESF